MFYPPRTKTLFKKKTFQAVTSFSEGQGGEGETASGLIDTADVSSRGGLYCHWYPSAKLLLVIVANGDADLYNSMDLGGVRKVARGENTDTSPLTTPHTPHEWNQLGSVTITLKWRNRHGLDVADRSENAEKSLTPNNQITLLSGMWAAWEGHNTQLERIIWWHLWVRAYSVFVYSVKVLISLSAITVAAAAAAAVWEILTRWVICEERKICILSFMQSMPPLQSGNT